MFTPGALTGVHLRNHQVLAYVTRYYQEHGYAPNCREIAQGIGRPSTSSICVALHELAAAGFLTPAAGRMRSYVPVR